MVTSRRVFECALCFKMRREEMWSQLATLGWVAVMVGCHAPAGEFAGSRLATADDRFSDTFTAAYINITYPNEHGVLYTETSEVS